MASLIALILMLTITASLVALPPVNAAVTYTYTHLFVGASPKVVGVGQVTLLIYWTDNIPPDIGEQAGAPGGVPIGTGGGRAAWENVKLTVTKPDNTTEDFAMPRSDPVGGGYLSYTPTVVGTYYVQAFFPETWKNTTANQAYYFAAVSIKLPFTVQQEPVALTWPETPLPNDYWTRPINSANHFWYELAGNWLGGAHEQPPGAAGGTTSNLVTGVGPESPHILWTQQYYVGGIQEERFASIGYQTQHYQGMGFSGLILNGVVHFTPRSTAHGNAGWAQLDLYTGEIRYLNYSDTRPSMGQVYNYESGNQHGGFAYLWQTSGVTLPEVVQVPHVTQINPGNMSVIRTAASTTINRTATPYAINVTGTLWKMIDGFTGNTICYIANVSSGGTAVYGKDGSLTYYNTANLGNTTNPDYRLTIWNASYGTMPSSQTGTGAWQWRPAGGTFGGANAYLGGLAYNYVHDGNVFWSLNVSMPSLIGPRNAVLNETATVRAIREGEYAIFATAGRNDERGIAPGWVMAMSLKPGQEGKWLWESTITTPPAGSVARNETVSMTGVYPESGVVTYSSAKLLQRWGYNMTTGALIWTSAPENQFQYYGFSQNVYNGLLYSFGYSGEIRAYNLTTGAIPWIYNCTTVGIESAYGGNYPEGIAEVCDGKLYLTNGEHSPTQPLMRGPNLRCINATTGEEIWKLLGYWGGMSPTSYNSIMADGIFVGLNYMDMQLYGIGKGPSATTVSAPQTVPSLGSSVTITGTVTDQSPSGKRNTNGDLDFVLKGTPAISDADMEAWMEYKFMQQAYPANAKGVEVTLTAIDPNNNYITIGTTTSDAAGNYGLAWTPEVPGTYHIIATFAGSKAYGGSYSTTYMTVGEAPPEPITPEPEPPLPPFEMYTLYATIAIIVAVAIATLLLLRKK